MALNNQSTTDQCRDSITSTISLWEKLHKTNCVPIDIANDNDFLDENDLSENDTEKEVETSDDEINLPRPLGRRFASTSNLVNMQQSSPLWVFDEYDQIKLIVHKTNAHEARIELQRRLLSQRLRPNSNDDEQIRSWNFGLSFIRFQLECSYSIDIMRLFSARSSPFWLKFKNGTQKQRRVRRNAERIKPIRYGYSPPFRVSLRYGALTDLDQFRYSLEHSWSNEPKIKWSLYINNDNAGGSIEWVMEEQRERKKKQLLASNVDRTVVVHLLPNGFAMYICQKCNMNEFGAQVKPSNVRRNDHRTPNRAGPFRPSFGDDRRLRQRPSYEKDKRLSVRNGIYFATVQFELRIDPGRLPYEESQNTVRQTFKLLVDFFTSRNITVCYGMVNSCQGPSIDSFPTINLPTLIMRYSWQMLVNVGYRLQVQMDDRFRDDLRLLSVEKHNADDLFYRVCVYLSRLFTFEPFVNLSSELHEAVKESKRKREDSAFGLISTLNIQDNKQAYIPSVTLTPTTIRIKPLKLCRTNRVLRAEQKFGKPMYHFALVDIRDENGSPLKSFDFRDLREHFLGYLKDGFTLMDSNRCYRYIHHSQSQLRARQFWFYHHEPGINSSFEEAYEWMGTFDQEKNIAKYASRVALCFSTTTPTIEIKDKDIHAIDDIETRDGKLKFTDGCGTMSEQLRDDIQELLKKPAFSAVQFRCAGAKGVVSVDPRLGSGHHLCIRHSMNKFKTTHRCFEVCKVSAPRSLYLNRQAILLLSYRKIPDSTFLILQQRNQLTLIRALLRNEDANNLLYEKLPYWFLPYGAKVDFVREPFFRQVLISACLNSTRELLRRTRIRVPRNKARNMFGIIDEYNVLKSDEVFIQYTRLNDYEDNDDMNKGQKTVTLHNCKVVITKNPCHHPGDIRTFTAVSHEALKHLKDVVVFSQQGDVPATHQISGSDLDGDEYAVIWHKDLVPLRTADATPYNYDSQGEPPKLNRPVTRYDINNTVLKIAESDYLGRLSYLHLAYADRYGVDSDYHPSDDVLSTIELAGAISEEVDSGKAGRHPLNEMQIRKQSKALENRRPDFMEKANMKSYKSPYTLGKLYRSSRRTLPGWNRLLQRHRHLRHLQVRTPEDEEIDDEEVQEQQTNADDDQKTMVTMDPSLLNTHRSRQDHEISAMASQLFFVYSQEILEILNLYGLSHESDLWCRNSMNNIGGELEDTAYTQLEQLAVRTRNAFFLRSVLYCEDVCNETTSFENLCERCKQQQNLLAIALYRVCYSGQNGSERAPILSLPWLFTTALLQTRHRELPAMKGLLSIAMETALVDLINKRQLQLGSLSLTFRTSNSCEILQTVHWTVCIFVEIVHYCLGSRSFPSWPMVLSKFIRSTMSFTCKPSSSSLYNGTDEWLLVFGNEEQNDLYAAALMSMEWTENDDELMHSYFVQLIEICFDISQTTTDDNNEYLQMSEEIILLLQRVAIDEIPWKENRKK